MKQSLHRGSDAAVLLSTYIVHRLFPADPDLNNYPVLFKNVGGANRVQKWQIKLRASSQIIVHIHSGLDGN